MSMKARRCSSRLPRQLGRPRRLSVRELRSGHTRSTLFVGSARPQAHPAVIRLGTHLVTADHGLLSLRRSICARSASRGAGRGPRLNHWATVAIDTARPTLDQHCRTAQRTIRPDHDREPHLSALGAPAGGCRHISSVERAGTVSRKIALS